MNVLTCGCGKRRAFSSMSFANSCEGCEECGTNLAMNDESRSKLTPHKPVTKYDELTGLPYQVCEDCRIIIKDPRKMTYEAWKPILESESHCKIIDDDGGRSLFRKNRLAELIDREEATKYFLMCTVRIKGVDKHVNG